MAAPAPAPAPAPPAPAPAYMGAGMAPEPGAAFGGTMIMAEGSPSPYAAAASPAAPTAARRAAKNPAVDLFATGQQERSPAGNAAAGATATSSADRLIGERNENSVLFSISALTAAAGAGKGNDDPFDLAGPSRNNGRGNVDDIMNLGGGMAGPMLAPPPLLAPVVEAPPPPPPVQMQMQMPVSAQPVMGAMGGPMAMSPLPSSSSRRRRARPR